MIWKMPTHVKSSGGGPNLALNTINLLTASIVDDIGFTFAIVCSLFHLELENENF